MLRFQEEQVCSSRLETAALVVWTRAVLPRGQDRQEKQRPSLVLPSQEDRVVKVVRRQAVETVEQVERDIVAEAAVEAVEIREQVVLDLHRVPMPLELPAYPRAVVWEADLLL